MGKKKQHHRPPEGRDRHHKPLIPVSQAPKPSAPPAQPVSPLVASVAGLNVVRQVIFEAKLDRPSWALDMLIAIEAAKRLGIQTFEIALGGGEVTRPQERRPMSPYEFLGFMGESWRMESNTTPSQIAKVTIYAVVIQ